MSYKIVDKDGHPIENKDGQNILGFDNHKEIELKDFSDKDRSFLAVASSEVVDRYDDIIMQKGWELENYRKNPVVMMAHDYGGLPVGRSLEEFIQTKNKVKRLMFRPQFAVYEQANLIYSLFKDEMLKAFSVGFLPIKEEPIKTEEDEEKKGFFFHEPTRYLEQELLEVSVAPVPANPDCLAEIKTMVKKGQLYIPVRYLQEDEGEGIELYDEYIHVKLTDGDKFTELYEDQLAPGVVRIYGKQKDEDEKELLVHKYIFSRKHFSEEQARDGVELFKEEKFMEDGHVDYRVDKYSGQSSVQVDSMPVLLECNLDFECKRKDLDIDPDGEEDKTFGMEEKDDNPCCRELTIGEDIDFKEDEYIEKELILKPYPTEHACRLESPDDFDKFARKNCYRKSDGKCIDYIFGIKGGKSKAQSLRYKKDVWTVSAAKKNCKDKDGTFEPAGEAVIEEMEGKIYIYRTSDVLEDKQREVLEESLKQKLEKDAVIIILDGGATLEIEKVGKVSHIVIKQDYKKDNEDLISIIKDAFDKVADQIVERLNKIVKAVVRKEKDADTEEEIIDLEAIETESADDEEITKEDVSKLVSESLKESLGRLPD